MSGAITRARWIGFKTIILREFGRILRIWGQTIVPSVVTAALYFVIFGSLIGQRIGSMDGTDYMQYIAPGLIMMAVITNSYANVSSSFYGAKFGRYLEEVLVSPLPNWVIVLGYVGGGVLRGLLVGLAVTVADAAQEVKDLAHWVMNNPGGRGAVRELIERILQAKGRWEDLVPSRLR